MTNWVQVAYAEPLRQPNEPDESNDIEDVVRRCSQGEKETIQNIVVRRLDEQYDQGDRNDFDDDRSDDDVVVVLRRLIEPFDPERRQKRVDEEDPHEHAVRAECRNEAVRRGERG